MSTAPETALADAPGTALPGAGATPEEIAAHLDRVWNELPFADALAHTEQLYGVLPLLALFPEDLDGHLKAVRDGTRRAALGLFTPNAVFDATAPTVRAVRGPDGTLTLGGRFRTTAVRADITLVALHHEDDATTRLALLPHTLDGLRHHGAGRARDGGWTTVDGAVLDARAVTGPVSRGPDGPLAPVIDAYGWEFSRRAVTWSAGTVAELRRSLAGTGEGTEALSTSQYLAHELSKLEIELSLAAAAASFGPEFKQAPAGAEPAAAVLVAATDLLARTVRVAEDMTTELGLVSGPGGDDWPAEVVPSCFGGRRMAEGELARRMGLVPGAARA
ncbi:hypothetical protein ABT354_24470 [Streptomyces sp. NPDC000594]|uniref:hypothetical protein n=1 Tax=Streptomyces sp. NPDC000594 TaxID=3154261 RepID=UPI00332F2681